MDFVLDEVDFDSLSVWVRLCVCNYVIGSIVYMCMCVLACACMCMRNVCLCVRLCVFFFLIPTSSYEA